MSPKAVKSDFKAILLKELNDRLGPYELPNDTKELENLAKRVVDELMKLNNIKLNVNIW